MKEDNNNIKNKRIIEGDEIDLVEVAKTIWANRKIVYKSIAVFFVLGLVVAFSSKVEYEASSKLLPDSQDGAMPNLGGLGGLAGLAGINLEVGGQGGTLSPELYPQIVQSMPFLLKVINEGLSFERRDTTLSAYFYFKEIDSPSPLGYVAEYSIGLPGKIKGFFSSEEPRSDSIIVSEERIIKLSKEDSKLIEKFKERISVNVDSETGIISLTAEMPDALAAAELARTSVDLLQEYIINYRISKARENLNFVRERYEEAKQKFISAQERLAVFSDRNVNVVTARAQTEQQRLQNEYNLAFEIYQGLAQQLEQAEIKVKENTPVFTVVEPVKVPVEKSKPKRTLIILFVVIIGGLFGVAIVFFKNLSKSIF